MAYKVGQLRQQPENNNLNINNSTYYTSLVSSVSTTVVDTINPYNSNKTFKDFAIQGSFERGQTYFLRAIIGKQYQYEYLDGVDQNAENNPNRLVYSLKLKDGNNQQLLSSFTVDAALSQDQTYTYSLVFKPNSNYSLLLFELQKTGYDYLKDEERTWRSIDFQTNGIICRLNNIIGKTYSKIGFQSRPGELIAINGYPIRVGRSGIYELDNGTPINSVMIAPNALNQIDPFLLDYMYEDTQEEV